MKFFADFHIHSHFSRATSQQMNIPAIAKSAKIKGIKLVGTSDFTHPGWLKEIKQFLKPVDNNLFEYDDVYFILTAEVSNIYEKKGLKRIHNIIFVPKIKDIEKINRFLSKYGKLEIDGRPIISIDSETMVDAILQLVPDAFIVPAHIWTPWFSLFGSNGGFNSVEECFGKQTKNIFAMETGLSSDPLMNWMWTALDNFALISNSDAHSPANIGREANFFDCELDYYKIIDAIKKQDSEKFKFTIEFFPQEGKYHWDGHRKCDVRISPQEAISNNNICPKCGKHITIGVMHRVISLGDRKLPKQRKIHFKHIIPLAEIISEVFDSNKDSVKVLNEYNNIINYFGTEFDALLYADYDELIKVTSHKIAKAICNIRDGKVNILPGYDGVYGKISVILDEPQQKKEKEQLSLF